MDRLIGGNTVRLHPQPIINAPRHQETFPDLGTLPHRMFETGQIILGLPLQRHLHQHIDPPALSLDRAGDDRIAPNHPLFLEHPDAPVAGGRRQPDLRGDL